MSYSPNKTPRERRSPTDRPSRLQHVTVERDDVAVCTMFPTDVSENAMSTQWLTATTDSFVALERRR
ncbi:DUF7511 domain-containing protein [Natrinema salaciae]|uniref:DUF7511 domain-containing protein n=1 Tax=Natrinema salaciae TaxID=1186196 RepID=A0A1H9C6N5_9EURY|nr:hypothetical protein [Natrinema salaciae]SEP96900.1 hypothetical protein SAMN04489841_0968 [Natrinema salaciae]